MLQDLPRVVCSTVVLALVATIGWTQSNVGSGSDLSAVEQIETAADTPIDQYNCEIADQDTESAATICTEQENVLIDSTAGTVPSEIELLEDGAYLRLGKKQQNETANDTILDLNPLALTD